MYTAFVGLVFFLMILVAISDLFGDETEEQQREVQDRYL